MSTVVPLTTDFEALTAGLATLYASGGGDWPEAVYSGIAEAAGQEWRSGVARSIIVIGDAPPHDPEPVTGYTASSIIDLLLDTVGSSRVAPVASSGLATPTVRLASAVTSVPAATSSDGSPIVLYTASASAELTESLDPVVTATGGLMLPIGDASGLDNAIRDALEDSTAAPIAAIGVPTPVIAGISTFASATGSTAGDPALTYEFDLDGDGTFETPEADGIADVTFAEPGAHRVAVRVTDTRGRASVATTDVEVLPAEAADPAFDPTTPTLTVTAPEEVDLSSSAPVSVGGGIPTDYLLVPGSGTEGVWTSPAAFIAPVPSGWASDGLPIPGTVPVGDYRLVIGSDDGRWGVAQIAVVEPDGTTAPTPSPRPSPSPTPAAPAPVGENGTPVGGADGSGPTVSEIPSTGADIAGWIALAAALAGVGVLLLVVRRRRNVD